MEPQPQTKSLIQIEKRTKFPKIAGILILVPGAIYAALALYLMVGSALAGRWLLDNDAVVTQGLTGGLIISLSLVGIVALVGGVCALKRRLWGMALAGAIFVMGSWLGIPAVVFLAMSKDEFRQTK